MSLANSYKSTLLVGATFALATVGCVGTQPGDGNLERPGGKADDPGAAGCTILSAVSGGALSGDELAALADPMSVVLSEQCPRTVEELSAAAEALLGYEREQTRTSLFSEYLGRTGISLNPPADLTLRAVIALDPVAPTAGHSSGSQPALSENGIFIGLPNVGFDDVTLRDPLDVIVGGGGGQLHFWKGEAGTWTFMGSSADIVTGGYDCTDGYCVPKLARQSECASCHVGGGMAFRTVGYPWPAMSGLAYGFALNHNDFQAGFPELGGTMRAATMEALTRGGNAPWNQARIDVLKETSVEELLRPLFCTMDIEFETAGKLWPGGPVSSGLRPIRGPFGWNLSPAAYSTVSDELDLHYLDHNRDRVDAAGFRSLNDAWVTRDYREQLVFRGIISRNFVTDVLSTDITRGLFSEARCELVSFAPDLSADEIGPEAIRTGFLSNLAGATSASAVELRSYLADTSDGRDHYDRMNAFMRACKNKSDVDYLRDMMKYTIQIGRVAREMAIDHDGIELGLVMPMSLSHSNMPPSNLYFDLETCELVSD